MAATFITGFALVADSTNVFSTSAQVTETLARAETTPRAKLTDLRTALDAELPAMREVFQALFPEGLTFRPADSTRRRVWAISGSPASTVSN